MIYDSLETLPYKLLVKIASNNDNINLLSTVPVQENELEKLREIWKELFEEYKIISPNQEEYKLLGLKKDIGFLECKHKAISVALVALDFEYNQELVDILISYGYTLTKENYYEDLKRISRESDGLLMKARNIKKRLPKVDENSVSTKVSLDRLFAFYTSVLGIDFDYNGISVTKFLGLKEQVDSKLKIAKEQAEKNKKTNHK